MQIVAETVASNQLGMEGADPMDLPFKSCWGLECAA